MRNWAVPLLGTWMPAPVTAQSVQYNAQLGGGSRVEFEV